MAKKLGLRQLYQKKYTEVQGIDPQIKASLGDIEDAFDMISWGDSANGKTNFTFKVMCEIALALNCKAVYVSWEEGHGKSLRDTLIRHNMLEVMGNRLEIMDGGTFDEIRSVMMKRKSAKIWVFDSIQAAEWTSHQCMQLKDEFVKSKRKKILLYISWAEGKAPKGATARDVKFFANIKVWVEKFVAFPTGRYGGNKNYVIWEEGAKKKWGVKLFNKHKSI